ncbi:MAG: bifunctional folylpolyglutamate synthase/dihydrofolate synthase [Candidatus Cryptobacteroides sp.]
MEKIPDFGHKNDGYGEEEYERLIESIFVRFPSFQKYGSDAYHPGLANMQAFDLALGHPHRAFRSIHVAGTNGKGSVSSIIASALAAAGYRTGLYTSPHLLDFRERAKICSGDGYILIPKEFVFEFCSKWGWKMDELGLSFFEITTALAFEWFRSEGVDFAVVETGLGGRLDSTNIITPVLSVITGIGLDHCDILGNTLQEIASEKAGIIKPGVPAVVWGWDEATGAVFERAGDARAEIEREWGGHAISGLTGNPIAFADREIKEDLDLILDGMDLKGDYQKINLRTALCALKLLGIDTDEDKTIAAIQHTAARTGFSGRWDKVCDHPLTIMDIGHNPDAMQHNFRQLSRTIREGGYSAIMVYGSVSDKDYRGVLGLVPGGIKVIFTNAQGRRAKPSAILAETARGLWTGEDAPEIAGICPKVSDAMALAASLAQTLEESGRKPLIYVGGSSYVVAEALKCIGKV